MGSNLQSRVGKVVTKTMRFWRLGLIVLLAASLLGLVPPGPVHATTLSVPSPYPTIQSAINAASPGDTILVSAGTYPEQLVIQKSLHLVGASRDSTVIDGQGMGTVVWINSSSVEVRGFTIRHSDQFGRGVHVDKANGVNITLNNVASMGTSGAGVDLFRSNNTLVDDDVFTSNLYAINVTSSQSERITGNQAIVNDTVGVQLEDSARSLVFNNTFAGGHDGVDVFQSKGNNITRNLFKGMKFFGILLEPDSRLTPQSQFPQNNTVNENTFQRDGYSGIQLQNATLNTFYHNDFFASVVRHVNPVAGTIDSPNFWDNGTLGGFVGGNYWDNYNGTDGDRDGIGDTPYVIGGGNQDSRPLMTPFLPVPVLIKSILANPSTGKAPLSLTLSASVLGTLTPIRYEWNFGDGSPTNASASPAHTYTRAGTYTVTLTVKDAGGAADSSTYNILVLATQSQPGPSYTIPLVIVGVLALLIVSGLLFWRKRRGRENQKAATPKR